MCPSLLDSLGSREGRRGLSGRYEPVQNLPLKAFLPSRLMSKMSVAKNISGCKSRYVLYKQKIARGFKPGARIIDSPTSQPIDLLRETKWAVSHHALQIADQAATSKGSA